MKSKIYEDMCIVNFTLQPANVNFGGFAAKTLRCSGLQILCQKTLKAFFDSLSVQQSRLPLLTVQSLRK